MKSLKQNLQELQRHWYKRLADEGFEDIEHLFNGEVVLKERADYRYRRIDPDERLAREEYFRAIGQMANDDETKFKNEVYRFVMIRHADGIAVNLISKGLIAIGKKRNPQAIRYIIRRHEMMWKVRCYNRKELDLKERSKK